VDAQTDQARSVKWSIWVSAALYSCVAASHSSAQDRPAGSVVLNEFRQGAKHQSSLLSASLSPDGARVVATSYDRFSRIWDAATGRLIIFFGGPGSDFHYVLKSTLSVDGDRLATCGLFMPVENGRGRSWAGGIVKLWDVKRNRELFRFVSEDFLDFVAIADQGRRLVVLTRDNQLHVVDIPDKITLSVKPKSTLRFELPSGTPSGHSPGRTVSISEAGDRLAVSATTGKRPGVLLYDTGKGNVRFLDPSIATGDAADRSDAPGVKAVAVSPDGSLVALRPNRLPRSVFLVRFDSLARAGDVRFDFDGENEVEFLKFSRDNRLLAAAGTDGSVRVFEIKTGKRVASHPGSGDPVRALAQARVVAPDDPRSRPNPLRRRPRGIRAST